MPNHSSITVVGHVGKDPELKDLGNTQVLNWSMAVNYKRGRVDQTNWYRVALFGKRAEVLAQYVKQGDPIMVTGEFYTRDYERNDGTPGYSLEINANEVVLLGGGGTREVRGETSVGTEAPASGADGEIPF